MRSLRRYLNVGMFDPLLYTAAGAISMGMNMWLFIERIFGVDNAR